MGNATLAATLTVTDNGDGTVDIVDSTGANITIDDIDYTDNASSDLDVTVQSLNAAGTAVGTTRTIADTQGTVVTGDITFTASDASKAYALFSSDTSGALTSAGSAALGTGAAENITFTGFGTSAATGSAATPASGVAAQTLTFVTDGASDSIAVAAGATAADIASSVNSNVDGISAKAVTGARLTINDAGASDTITFTLNEVTFTTVSIASTDAAASAAIAGQINGNEALAATLRAVDNGDGSVDIFDSTGANIHFGDITLNDNAGSDLDAAVQALDATGAVSGTSQAITSTQGTMVTGDVVFTVSDTTKSYQMFSSDASGAITTSASSTAGTSTLSSTTTTTGAVSAVDISTAAGASSALATIDAALTTLDSQRATLGAVQNRFDSVISNLSNVAENTSAARSRIMDADFASETAQLARTQILQQAGISVLAQANAQPQNVLALLQ
jgi:flagellin